MNKSIDEINTIIDERIRMIGYKITQIQYLIIGSIKVSGKYFSKALLGSLIIGWWKR
jgi:hypothetical protein